MNSSLIQPTSPNISFNAECERLISHNPITTLPTLPNIGFHPEGERLIGALQPTSPNSFLDGGEPNQSSGSYYSINDNSPTLLPTSPKTILNSRENPGERLISHYSTDGSSPLLLPTSPKTFPNSRDNQDCPPGERLKRSHYSMERSTPVLPTSPNNVLDSEDNRFCPSDERLISHYLMQKMLGNDDQVTQIPEVDILSCEPPDLLGIAGDAEQCYKEAYYFYRRQSYFTSKDRCKRTTGDGYWKPTGKLREIRNGANGEVIGSKRCLVFHYGRSVGQRTGYTMHEYSSSAGISTPQPVMDLVLCKVMKKSSKSKTVTKQSNKKARTVPPPASNETVTITTPPPLQREEEAHESRSSSTQTDWDSAKEIAAFPDKELDIDEILRLLGIDFDFDSEISDTQLQQQRMPETEYFPGMVQQSG
ncbi:NAC domain-containing protein 100 [Linum perenne]